MTLNDIIKKLRDSGIDNAPFEARILVEHFTKIPASKLVLMRDTDFSGHEFSAILENAVARRISREPLQYIIGHWEFMGHEYEVSPSCLIPREDTAVLVENALKATPQGAKITDLCTGSGCVAVSMLLLRPDITAYAVELYHDTAEIAAKNANNLGVGNRFNLIEGDVTHDVFDKTDVFDVIVSNPPYILSSDMESLEPELFFEPKAALDGGIDGLDVIAPIMEIYPAHIKKGGAMFIEIGWDIGDAVSLLAEKLVLSGNAVSYEIIRDSENRDRVLSIKF